MEASWGQSPARPKSCLNAPEAANKVSRRTILRYNGGNRGWNNTNQGKQDRLSSLEQSKIRISLDSQNWSQSQLQNAILKRRNQPAQYTNTNDYCSAGTTTEQTPYYDAAHYPSYDVASSPSRHSGRMPGHPNRPQQKAINKYRKRSEQRSGRAASKKIRSLS